MMSLELETTKVALSSLARGDTGPQRGFSKSGPLHSNVLHYPAALPATSFHCLRRETWRLPGYLLGLQQLLILTCKTESHH